MPGGEPADPWGFGPRPRAVPVLAPPVLFPHAVSAGGGAILTANPGATLPLFTDVYINLLNVWLEWKVGDYKLFARVEAKASLGIGNNLLGSNIIYWGPAFPPVALGLVIPWK